MSSIIVIWTDLKKNILYFPVHDGKKCIICVWDKTIRFSPAVRQIISTQERTLSSIFKIFFNAMQRSLSDYRDWHWTTWLFTAQYPLALLSTTNNAMQWPLQNPDKGHVDVGQIGWGGETEEEGGKLAKIFIFLAGRWTKSTRFRFLMKATQL